METYFLAAFWTHANTCVHYSQHHTMLWISQYLSKYLVDPASIAKQIILVQLPPFWNPYPSVRIPLPETQFFFNEILRLKRRRNLEWLFWITRMDDTLAEAPVTEPQSWAEGRSNSSLYEQLVSPSSLNMEGVSRELLKASGKWRG